MNGSSKKNISLEFIVIAGIVIVAISGFLIFVNGIRAKSRDVRREDDMKQLRTALDLYITNHRSYPVCAENAADACLFEALLADGALRAKPRDPRNAAGICGAPDAYVYCYSSGGASYVLRYHLETDSIRGKIIGWQSISP